MACQGVSSRPLDFNPNNNNNNDNNSPNLLPYLSSFPHLHSHHFLHMLTSDRGLLHEQ